MLKNLFDGRIRRYHNGPPRLQYPVSGGAGAGQRRVEHEQGDAHLQRLLGGVERPAPPLRPARAVSRDGYAG